MGFAQFGTEYEPQGLSDIAFFISIAIAYGVAEYCHCRKDRSRFFQHFLHTSDVSEVNTIHDTPSYVESNFLDTVVSPPLKWYFNPGNFDESYTDFTSNLSI